MDQSSKSLKKATLAFLINKNQILLGIKKKGLGQGKLNGIGGKVKEKQGESIEKAMVRETREEIGVTPTNYDHKAVLKFYFPYVPQNQDWNQEVHVYLVDQWQGKPQESSEMKPLWIPIEKIPYQKMWSDDLHWLPHILAGKQIRAEFTFNLKEQVEKKKVTIL